MSIRNVRNFYIQADIAGRATELKGGPKNKDGGMTVNIYQRDEGEVASVLRIEGYVDSNSELVLEVFDGKDELLHTKKTKR